MQIITNSEKQTFNFAKKIAQQLKGGEIIGLIGELGAGKTIFVKGLAQGLGIKKNIVSPTFVLMKIYQIRNPKLIPRRDAGFNARYLVHVDAYRIKSPQDIIAVGAQEYFNRLDAVVVIEWADKIYPPPNKRGVKKILPGKTRYVKIKNQGENKRLINF